MFKSKKSIIDRNITDSDSRSMVLTFLICCIAVIVLSFVVSYYENKDKNIIIEGEDVIKGLQDVDNYDFKVLTVEVSDYKISVIPTNKQKNYDEYNVYYLLDTTSYYKRTITSKYNEEGEIVSTFKYIKISRSEYQEEVESSEDGVLTYLWVNSNGKCTDILISNE